MIRYALLSGADYTPGVFGVGTVNATEILQAFPGTFTVFESNSPFP
jgi:5'-3' exonuclease